METILIVVDYEEFKPETYKGCYLYDEKKLFESYTGNFKSDYAAVYLTAVSICANTGQKCVNSSSVDDWFMDSNTEDKGKADK